MIRCGTGAVKTLSAPGWLAAPRCQARNGGTHFIMPGPRFRRRIQHHVLIGLAALPAGLAVGILFPRADLRTLISTGTAYVALGCVALSLTLGPLNVLRGRPNPVSADWRRDLGIWGGIVGLAHVGFGLMVHLRGTMWLYFVSPPKAHSAIPVRLDAFGAANYLGLVAGAVLLILLLLSNDRALRRLGTLRWKAWQRLNYLGAVAILGHGVLYQALERRRAALIAVFCLVVAGTLAVQGLGIRRIGRERCQ